MIDNGFQYHWLTAYTRGRMSGHQLDWARQPAFFKDYQNVSSFALPRPENLPQDSLFALAKKDFSTSKNAESPLNPDLVSHNLSLSDLASLFILTSAPTAKSTFPQGKIWYRSNASAGALHPLELYVSFPGDADLPPGLYHYDLLTPALNRISRNPLSTAFSAAFDRSISATQVDLKKDNLAPVLLISAMFFRTAWKYRDRAYRYLLLDCGHALENMALALRSMRIDFEIVLDFSDSCVNQSLNFDDQHEVCLAALRLRPFAGDSLRKFPDELPSAETDVISGIPHADNFIAYPLLNEIHQATSVPLLNGSAENKHSAPLFRKLSDWHDIPCDSATTTVFLSHVESLSRRRSRRNFTANATPLKVEKLYLLLDLLLQKALAVSGPQPEIAFCAAGIEGLNDGLYLLDRGRRCFALLDSNTSPSALAAAALDQRWLAQAALQFIFFADLESAAEKYGPRSYRYLNLAAGRLGQRLYLGATALNLGCCAVGAFYDRELAASCSLPENYDPLYLLALGPVAGK